LPMPIPVPKAASPIPKPQAIAMPKKDHNPAACAAPSAARAVEANPNTIIPLKLAIKPFLVI
jgi:hypothetical protein